MPREGHGRPTPWAWGALPGPINQSPNSPGQCLPNAGGGLEGGHGEEGGGWAEGERTKEGREGAGEYREIVGGEWLNGEERGGDVGTEEREKGGKGRDEEEKNSRRGKEKGGK